jgi:hypothetical protein
MVPYRSQALTQIIKHGLLRCTNQNCGVPVINRNRDADNRGHFCHWNRNLDACLNMLHIVRSLRENSQIPERVRRAFP